MLDKNKLLNDLKEMKNEDERKKRETNPEDWAELSSLSGSIINLETLIEFIESGKYDK